MSVTLSAANVATTSPGTEDADGRRELDARLTRTTGEPAPVAQDSPSADRARDGVEGERVVPGREARVAHGDWAAHPCAARTAHAVAALVAGKGQARGLRRADHASVRDEIPRAMTQCCAATRTPIPHPSPRRPRSTAPPEPAATLPPCHERQQAYTPRTESAEDVRGRSKRRQDWRFGPGMRAVGTARADIMGRLRDICLQIPSFCAGGHHAPTSILGWAGTSVANASARSRASPPRSRWCT